LAILPLAAQARNRPEPKIQIRTLFGAAKVGSFRDHFPSLSTASTPDSINAAMNAKSGPALTCLGDPAAGRAGQESARAENPD
jgi:hypothetical protein